MAQIPRIIGGVGNSNDGLSLLICIYAQLFDSVGIRTLIPKAPETRNESLALPMSNFAFLQPEWSEIFEAAAKAEAAVIPDPRAACFYARRALELAVGWAYKSDASLKIPYQDNISALVHEPSFKTLAGDAVFTKARLIIKLGNQAVHSHGAIPEADSLTAVRELFHVGYWFARNYARRARPAPGLVFDSAALPTSAIPKQTIDQLAALETALRQRDKLKSAHRASLSELDALFASLQHRAFRGEL